ncbi:hypothetical protein SDC9_66570 [bioreactor metagenome]|uniref:Uncharacterized protein n=1 Tax=bioreactor metagenome TaxID=1076179 RepID=A0A644XWU4_9ZZZZ
MSGDIPHKGNQNRHAFYRGLPNADLSREFNPVLANIGNIPDKMAVLAVPIGGIQYLRNKFCRDKVIKMKAQDLISGISIQAGGNIITVRDRAI